MLQPTRTCATCCASAEGECMNLVAVPYDPGNRCERHETEAEFTADVEALKRFRVSIGLPPWRADQ